MPAVLSSWMIGGIVLREAATFVVGGNNVVIPAGSYYLWDSTDALNLCKVLEAGIAVHYAGSTVRLLKNRRVRIDFNGNSVTFVVPASLQEALGFTSSPYGAATSRTSENVPGLLWSAGWPERTEGAPVGTLGYNVHDRVMKSSPSGLTTHVTRHYSTTKIGISWSAVKQSRAWTASESPGEFCDFFERVIVPGDNMKLYSQVTEDESSTDVVTLPTGLGPYVVPEPPYDWYQRFVPNSDSLGANISFEMQVTGEYSN